MLSLSVRGSPALLALLGLLLLGCEASLPMAQVPPAPQRFLAPPGEPLPGAPPPAAEPAPSRPPPPAGPYPAFAHCAGDYGPAVQVGLLGDPAIVEASGVASSRIDPSVLWIHNDSGDTARVFAVRTDGRAAARLEIDGVTAVDFEDIAAAPCPDRSGSCLWISDTGDNGHHRSDAAIYVVREPDLRGVAGATLHATPIMRLPIAWPGAPVDAEAILVPHTLDAVYLFEKIDASEARLFRYGAPFRPGERVTLEPVARVASPGIPIKYGRMITGASMHPAGDRLLLRVYTGVFEYRLGPGQTPADLGHIEPRMVALGPLSEPQGEAVAYDAAGTGVWTVSEDPHQKPGQPLHHYDCVR